MDSRWK